MSAERRTLELLAGEARVLEMVAGDHPLPQTLDTLARVFEAHADGMRASILILENGTRVRHAAAPSLPAAWAKLVDGEPIGPDRGSCGTAAYMKQPVIVTDIATDPRWALYRDAALSFGFRACWSVPITRGDGTVLGTFAFYYSEPRTPSAQLMDLAMHASRLAVIAIDRHQQKEKLRHSELRARLIVEHALDANIQMDREGRVIAWSPRAETLFGWRTGEALGRAIAELVIPDRFHEQHRIGLRDYFDSGGDEGFSRRMDLVARTRDGREFPVQVAIAPIHVGDEITFSAFIQDMTAAKEAEETRRQLRERERVEAILQAAPTAVSIVSGHTLLYANPKFMEMFGLTVGDDARRWYVDVTERERIMDEVAHGRHVDAELQGYAANGDILDLLANYQPIVFGSDSCVMNWLMDITDRKRAEESLRRAKNTAEAATRTKAMFLANMSHEIRTPLNAILGYAQLLQRDAALDDGHRRKIDVIHSSGRHLLTLINDILEMSKIDAGRATLLLQPFNLIKLMDDIELMFAELSGAKGLSLVFRRAGQFPPAVLGDAGKIRQVVLNLLSNAVKFTTTGEISVTTTCVDRPDGRHDITIVVTDTGAGIEPESLGHIFEAFDQSASGVRVGGTGLGLAISRSFARLMGGDITVESVVGKGSAFVFRFDVAGAAEATRLVPTAPMPFDITQGQTVEGLTLSRLLGPLPADLVADLRQAVIQARAARIYQLADRVSLHSAPAAAQIRALTEQFRYDTLLAALDSGVQS